MFSIVKYFANEVQILVFLVSPGPSAVLFNRHFNRGTSHRLGR